MPRPNYTNGPSQLYTAVLHGDLKRVQSFESHPGFTLALATVLPKVIENNDKPMFDYIALRVKKLSYYLPEALLCRWCLKDDYIVRAIVERDVRNNTLVRHSWVKSALRNRINADLSGQLYETYKDLFDQICTPVIQSRRLNAAIEDASPASSTKRKM